ncbi:MAG: PAS domain-containing protein [Chloroflexi bacterium]|nr:PAS domain-containing protein [Chloroflexota bacterium]OJW04119.1 MAG: hypothetical protein BGO39_06420 [Chloroflexi bacterium 54-19]
MIKTLFDSLVGQGLPFEREARLIRKNQTRIWAVISLSPLRDEKGKVQSAVGIFLDISDRKGAEEALSRNMDELTRFNRATVSRELRMIELKKEVNDLNIRLGEGKRYPLKFTGEESGEENDQTKEE